MSNVNDPNLGLSFGYSYGESPWNSGMDSNMVILGGMASLSVKSRVTTSQPSGQDGDVYYVPTGATGADWAANPNTIAIYSDKNTKDTNNVDVLIGWTFVPVKNGWNFTVQDEENLLVTYGTGDGGGGFSDTVDTSDFITPESSYEATGNVSYAEPVKFTGNHTEDKDELSTIADVEGLIEDQDFDNFAKKDSENNFTGENSFTSPVSGVDATQDEEFTTLSQLESKISDISLTNVGDGAGVAKENDSGDLKFKSIKSLDDSVSISSNDDEIDLSVSLPASVSNFLELSDSPDSYLNQENKNVSVNASGNGLTFTSPTVETFLGLSDTPSDFSGFDGYYVTVDGSSLVFTELPEITGATAFTELSDAPNTIPSGEDFFLKASVDGNSLVFSQTSIPKKSTDLTDMPQALANNSGKYLRLNSGSSAYELSELEMSFLGLTDTPSDYSEGFYLASGSNGLSFVEPPQSGVGITSGELDFGQTLGLDFTGDVTVTSEVGSNKVTVDFQGGGSGGSGVQVASEDSDLGEFTRLNFSGGVSLEDQDNGTVNINITGEGSSVPVIVSETAPEDPEEGILWYDSSDTPSGGVLYLWYVNGVENFPNWIPATINGKDGLDGTDGTDGTDGLDGVGVPAGGTARQSLVKVNGVDFNTEWVDERELITITDDSESFSLSLNKKYTLAVSDSSGTKSDEIISAMPSGASDGDFLDIEFFSSNAFLTLENNLSGSDRYFFVEGKNSALDRYKIYSGDSVRFVYSVTEGNSRKWCILKNQTSNFRFVGEDSDFTGDVDAFLGERWCKKSGGFTTFRVQDVTYEDSFGTLRATQGVIEIHADNDAGVTNITGATFGFRLPNGSSTTESNFQLLAGEYVVLTSGFSNLQKYEVTYLKKQEVLETIEEEVFPVLANSFLTSETYVDPSELGVKINQEVYKTTEPFVSWGGGTTTATIPVTPKSTASRRLVGLSPDLILYTGLGGISAIKYDYPTTTWTETLTSISSFADVVCKASETEIFTYNASSNVLAKYTFDGVSDFNLEGSSINTFSGDVTSITAINQNTLIVAGLVIDRLYVVKFDKTQGDFSVTDFVTFPQRAKVDFQIVSTNEFVIFSPIEGFEEEVRRYRVKDDGTIFETTRVSQTLPAPLFSGLAVSQLDSYTIVVANRNDQEVWLMREDSNGILQELTGTRTPLQNAISSACEIVLLGDNKVAVTGGNSSTGNDDSAPVEIIEFSRT